ncbi:MAG: large repetitive protein [Blastocatellia bacterium]|nr:large repetitive protein [Blastocatellia bacterium]
MRKVRISVFILAGATALCLTSLHRGQTQSPVLRRVTNTTEEGINLNPSISGDGRVLAFESTEDIAGGGGTDRFRAIRANVASDPAAFFQMGGTRAVAPAISQDGSRIAFTSKDDPLGTNPDGNSEVFLLEGSRLIQVTNTSPGEVATRVTNGNFQPSISDDGRFIAFSSNRDLAGQNSDGNLEIFFYDTVAASFTQLTNTTGTVGASDAKISGNGASVAYIRDSGATPSAKRDLIEQPRLGLGPTILLAGNMQSLAITYGRAISDDGSRVVFAAETATNTTQVFLFDGRGGAVARQITSLGSRTTEVPLHPTISGDGTRIAFATRRTVSGAAANSDGGVELYVFDIPSSQMTKVTNAPSSASADVVSSLNDDGSVVAFNFPRVLSGTLDNPELANDSEIYMAGVPSRPSFGAITILNGASFGKEPSTTKASAPDSIAVAIGGALANSTQQSQRLPNGTFPANVGGTTVTVNGRAAQIFFVSPGQVNFLLPPQTEIGTAEVSITNSENFTSHGTVPTLRSAPGVFTKNGDGSGPGVILNSGTLQDGPFDPSDGNLRLTIFTTGTRNASQNFVAIGGRVINPESVSASPDLPGLDEIHVLVPRDLRGAGTVDLFVQSDGRASNPVSVTFSGDASRDVLINEVLADPPDGIAGDANRDGVRDSSDDEFIELVNTTTHDIDISGYQLFSRSSSTTTDTLRHRFAAGSILAACSASVVFGGGALDPNDPAFAGALVVKASSGGLSLTNGGGAITLRDSTGAIITSLTWGGSTGLNGDANQSMTRSPDISGTFVLHQSASGDGDRSFSPGTQVNGAGFIQCNSFVRIEVTPSSAAIDAGTKQQFTARALNASGNEVSGVIFSWQSSNTAVATIDQNGLGTSFEAGLTHITASAHGTQSAEATLTVREVPRVLTRIDVAPRSATIPASGRQQFTAHGIDQFGNEMSGLTFSWESANPNAATIDQTGLAFGTAEGQSTIRASSQSITGSATLNITAPTVVLNEVLADPPAGTVGDANHDGTRDSAQDEFVELVNSSSTPVDISGWTLRTHSTTSSTETVRHTFAANAVLPLGETLVIFGGGTFNSNDSLFGCSQVVKASSGGLSLTNGGLTILVHDGSGNLVTQFSYGSANGLNGGNAQSITRSPDIKGSFVLHSTIAGARKFSPGLKVDGTPFGNCPGHPAKVTISPPSSAITVGQTAPFTAQAFDQFGRAMVGVAITFDSDNTAVATPDLVSTNPGTGIATATVSAHNPGTAHITASVTDGGTTAHSDPATLTVNGPSLAINDVSATEGNAGITTFSFTVSLSTPATAGGVTFNIATQDGTATNADNDYVARILTSQTIPAGLSTYTFDVAVNGDVILEPNETFLVNMSNVSGASIGDGQGVGTIINDDSPSLSVSDVAAFEGDNGTTTFTFIVSSTLPAPPGGITFDIATTDGAAAAGSADYVARSLSSQTIQAGQTSYTFDVTVNGDTLVEPNEAFSVNISNVNNAGVTDGSGTGTIQNDDSAALVISQVFGGGDNSGAPYRNDFVELYNRGTTTVDFSITPYSIQYASVGANFGANKTNLSKGIIAPGRYYLVQEAGGTTNGVALPAPDAIGTITMSNTAGKLALVAGITLLPAATCPGDDLLTPFNPTSGAISDLAGYGNSASTPGHCYEGAGPAGAPSNTTAAFRKAGGCVDTNDNAADFLSAPANPRNTTSPVGDCKPEITINNVAITEGNTGTVNANFAVTLSAVSGNAVTVNYATADGTATAPADYQSTSGMVTFNPGVLTQTITIPINGDTLDEPSETFFVNLSNAANGTIIDSQGQGTINDNDPAPSLSIKDVSIIEGDSGTTPLVFTITLSLASGQTVMVNYATADNTATAGNDYQSASGTLTFSPGETSKTISVAVNGDTTFEQNETFFVNLTTPMNATITDAQAQGTIVNDDAAPPTPTFSINDLNITEGNNDAASATFNVTLTPASNQIVTVDFATANGTATTAGSDYQSASGTLTFNPGDTTKQIGITVNGDLLVEPDETFFVNLTNPIGGAVIGDNQALGTIQNDDLALLVISQVYGGGGNSGTTFKNDFIEIFNRGTTTVSLDGYSVQYAGDTASSWSKTNLTNGLIAPGRYYLIQEAQGANGTSNLPTPDAIGSMAMATSAGKVALVSNTILLNGACPANTSILDLVGYGASASCSEGSTPAAAPGNATADVRKGGGCVDNTDNAGDFFVHTPSPRNSSDAANTCSGQTADIAISDVTVTEGDSGTVSANFTVSLIAASAATVTVDYATANGTAIEPSDYNAIPTTQLVFNPGETSKIVTVLVNGDTLDEPEETFFVILFHATNASILDNQGQGTITDNDVPPTLTVNDVSLNEGNTGSTTFHFIVSLSAPALTGGVTFDIATQDGTAKTAGGDYSAKSQTSQTIAAGSTTFAFDVSVNGDTDIEMNESFFVNVSNVTGATVGNGQGQGTIQNDDSPALSINDVTVTEGNSGATPSIFTVTLSPPSNQTVTVDYATSSVSPATAAAGTDYISTNGSLTFNPGETSKPITVQVKGDTANEAICETLFVILSNPVNAEISPATGQGTVGITDDDGSKLIITQVYGGGSNSGATFRNDFVEVFNRGATTVDFSTTNYSVQYASATGSFSSSNTITLSSGTVAPGQFFLIKLAPTTPTTGTALPAADATNTGINMSATDGKVALVLGAAVAATTNGCPTGVTVADLIGYGSANCSEATPTAVLTATRSARRTVSCKDTNNNATDFIVVSNPDAPRNTAATSSPCGCSTSYSSLFSLDRDSWKEILAELFIDDFSLLPADQSCPRCDAGGHNK